MTSFKYIMIKSCGLDTPVIFPEWLGHDEAARMVFDKSSILSAGFVTISKDEHGTIEAHCGQESVSLKIKSRPEDSDIITHYLSAGD